MRRFVVRFLTAGAVLAGLTLPIRASAVPPPPVDGGDFNGDTYADLAVGVPYEDVGGVADAGGVNVIYGSVSGLSATAVPDQFLSQAACGGALEQEDIYGISVASGDLDGDGFDDLAFGGINEDLGAIDNAGAVCVLYGSPGGLSSAGAQIWHQDVGAVEGTAAAFDRFGFALTIGDFNLDGYGDLAVGSRRNPWAAISMLAP